MRRAKILLLESFPIVWSFSSILITSIHAAIFAAFLFILQFYGMVAYGCPDEDLSAILLVTGFFLTALVCISSHCEDWIVERLPKLQFSLRSLLTTCGFVAAFMPMATMEWSFLTAALVSAQTAIVIAVLYFVEGWTTRGR